MSRPPRILHAPANVGNQPYSLSRAERSLGLESDVVDYIPAHELAYRSDYVYDLGDRHTVVKGGHRLAFALRAARRYDVFHYNFGQALVPLRLDGRVFTELGLLKRLGRTVIVTFQGCDVRPQAACSCSRADCAAHDRWRGPNAAAMLRHADRAFYLNPDLGRYLPGARFLPYASVDVRAVEPVPPPDGAEVVIAHMPTDRSVKGTEHVIAAVEALRAEGLGVRLDLVEGVRHVEALDRMVAADIVVDQLMLGWYGGVSVEAMARARPVVCHIDQEANPFSDRLPIVTAGPATIRDVLRDLASDGARRAALGARSREFVLAEHDPAVLARRVLDGLIPLPATA